VVGSVQYSGKLPALELTLDILRIPSRNLTANNLLLQSIDRRFIAMLVNTNYFTDYVELVIVDERACLTNIVIFNFLATYLPRVSEVNSLSDFKHLIIF